MVSRGPPAKRPSARATNGSLEERLAVLEAQVAALVAHTEELPAVASAPQKPQAASDPPPRKFWAIDGVRRSAETRGSQSGGVVFAGHVVLPLEETYAWQIEADTNDLLASDWSVAHAQLAALAHPIRLIVLKALIEGKRDTQSLASLPGMGTTGQLYHHLKELEAAGWIRQPRRGEYIVLAERVVSLLVILAACEVTQQPMRKKPA